MNTRHYAPVVALVLLTILPACGGFRLPKPQRDDSEVTIRQNNEPSTHELQDALAVLGVHVRSMNYEVTHGDGRLEFKTAYYQDGQLVKEHDGSALGGERAGKNALTLFTREDGGTFSVFVQLNGSRVSVGAIVTAKRMTATAIGGPRATPLDEDAWTPIYYRYANEDSMRSSDTYSLDDIVARYDEVIAVLVKRTSAAK